VIIQILAVLLPVLKKTTGKCWRKDLNLSPSSIYCVPIPLPINSQWSHFHVFLFRYRKRNILNSSQ